MRKQLDEMSTLLKQHNIAPPREKKHDEEAPKEDIERCHDLKATLSPLQILEPPTTWFPPKNPSPLSLYEEDVAFSWEATLKYQLLGEVQLNYSMVSSRMFSMFLLLQHISCLFIKQPIQALLRKLHLTLTRLKSQKNILEISQRKGNVNHASKEYEFFRFLPISHSTTLLIHSNNTRKLWHDIFGHLNLKYL